MNVEETTFASEPVEQPKARQFELNPTIVEAIKTIVHSLKPEYPETSLSNLVYQTTKSILKNPKIRPENASVAPAIFAYYLEVFSDLYDPENKPAGMDEGLTSLFLLFDDNYNDTTLRHLLITSGNSIIDILADKVSNIKNIDMKRMMGHMTQITLLSESIRKYSSVKYRKANKHYITWLYKVFGKVLSDPELMFMDNDTSVKSVTDQIIARNKVITL